MGGIIIFDRSQSGRRLQCSDSGSFWHSHSADNYSDEICAADSCGLAVALAFRCSVFNIGVEGQLMVGAMSASIFGAYFSFWSPLHIFFVIIMSMGAGMLWAAVPAFLKLKANVNVVISTIMFNYVATFLVQYLVLGPFKGDTAAASTHTIHRTAWLPAILPKPLQLNLGFVIAIVMVIIAYLILNNTKQGYEMKAVGFNSTAARFAGIM